MSSLINVLPDPIPIDESDEKRYDVEKKMRRTSAFAPTSVFTVDFNVQGTATFKHHIPESSPVMTEHDKNTLEFEFNSAEETDEILLGYVPIVKMEHSKEGGDHVFQDLNFFFECVEDEVLPSSEVSLEELKMEKTGLLSSFFKLLKSICRKNEEDDEDDDESSFDEWDSFWYDSTASLV